MAHMEEANASNLDHVMSVLQLQHDDMAALLGVSRRSLFRWRQTGTVADTGVVQMLACLRGIFDDARERGDLGAVVDFIRHHAGQGGGVLLRCLFRAVPTDSLRENGAEVAPCAH